MVAKLILEVDPNLWRCVFFLKEDKEGYEDQCVLTGVGGCCGDVHLRPPACPLKEDTSEKRFEEFKAGAKNYFDLTDKLVETLADSCKELYRMHDGVIRMLKEVNTKVNCLAEAHGWVEPQEIQKEEKH